MNEILFAIHPTLSAERQQALISHFDSLRGAISCRALGDSGSYALTASGLETTRTLTAELEANADVLWVARPMARELLENFLEDGWMPSGARVRKSAHRTLRPTIHVA